MYPLLGYPDRLYVEAGDDVGFMINCDGSTSFEAEIVRVISGDGSPKGPGVKVEPVPGGALGKFPGVRQSTELGSFAVVENPALPPSPQLGVVLALFPTTPKKGEQAVIARWNEEQRRGFCLALDADGHLVLRVGNGRDVFAELRATRPLLARQWFAVAAGFDLETGRMVLHQAPLKGFPAELQRDSVETQAQLGPIEWDGLDLTMAGAWSGRSAKPRMFAFYNGRIEAPRILARLPYREDLVWPTHPAPTVGDGATLAAWDFSRGITGDLIEDIGPRRLNGRLVNMPTRGVTGAQWDGSENDWTKKPEHYAAIHFHDDDLEDAGWAESFRYKTPRDLRSGAYAAKLTAGDTIHYVPFFVIPRKGEAKSKIAFLASTVTYMAYSNSHYRVDDPNMEMKAGNFLVLNRWDLYLNEHREVGMSPYDTHSDGYGVAYSSWKRPLFSMHLNERIWTFNADTHILDWLEALKFEYDVITDHAVHYEGYERLKDYNVIITGSHPEYWTTQMWDAAAEYQRAGGRIMYLGGNGFYWRAAIHPEKPWMIEVRRAETGARYWETEPGEAYHSFTGEYGGLWRRIGRPPQGLVGLGTVATGFDYSSYYRRRPEADDPRVAFIFQDIPDEIIGDFGIMGGGAAGEEIDRADPWLGTPPHALIVARSEKHTRYFNVVPEETTFHHPTINGEEAEKCYADIIFYECPNGGAVFATGSISWCSSLAWNGYDNNVSRMTANVLRRFANDLPFEMPEPHQGSPELQKTRIGFEAAYE